MNKSERVSERAGWKESRGGEAARLLRAWMLPEGSHAGRAAGGWPGISGGGPEPWGVLAGRAPSCCRDRRLAWAALLQEPPVGSHAGPPWAVVQGGAALFVFLPRPSSPTLGLAAAFGADLTRQPKRGRLAAVTRTEPSPAQLCHCPISSCLSGQPPDVASPGTTSL